MRNLGPYNSGIEYDDLIQTARIALVKAAREWRGDSSFRTCAVKYMIQAVRNYCLIFGRHNRAAHIEHPGSVPQPLRGESADTLGELFAVLTPLELAVIRHTWGLDGNTDRRSRMGLGQHELGRIRHEAMSKLKLEAERIRLDLE